MPVVIRLGTLLALALIILIPQHGHAEDKWTSLSFASGWQNYGQGYQSVTAVKSGSVVTVSGLAAREKSGTWGHIATLPADMRPKQRLIFNTSTHDQNARVDVLPNGQIHFVVGNQRHDWVSLDGISFDLGSLKPLPLTSGWENYGYGYAGAGSTLNDNTVSLSGLVRTGKGNLIATLPNNLRPTNRLVFNLNSHEKVSRVDVMPDGRVLWIYQAPSRGWVSLNGITFERKPGKPLQLIQGWGKHGDADFASANVTRIGNSVRLSGLVSGNKWGHFANLPKGMCPTKRLIFDLNNHDGSARVDVLPTCQIAWVAGAKKHGWINLDGLSFIINPEGQQVATKAKPETLPWIRIPGGAMDVSVGANGAVWVIGENKKNDGFDIWRYAGLNKLSSMPGSGERIAVDPIGHAWVVTSRQNILYWDGNSWTDVPGEATDIDVGANGDVWIAGADGAAWQWQKRNWRKVGGNAISRIAVDPEKGIWAIANGTQIWRFDGRNWKNIPGAATEVGVGADGSVWVIGTDSAPYLWDGKTWIKHDGAINNLSVDPKGYVWATNINKNIWVDRRSASYKNPPKPVDQTASRQATSSSGGGLQHNLVLAAPDAAAAETAFKKYPHFNKLSLNWQRNGNALSDKLNINGTPVTAFGFTAQNGNAVITGLLADEMSLGDLLDIKSGNPLVSGYKLEDVIVIMVPAAARSLSHKIASFPDFLSDALKTSDPSFEAANAEIVLEPGLTYFAKIEAKGVVKTAFDMMQLKDLSLAGKLASADYSTPQSVVTLRAALKNDPLKKVMGNGFQVIKVASSAKPSLYVTLTGTADIEVGYDSAFEIFDQDLDGKLFFARSGTAADLETKIAIQMSRQGDWKEPKLLPTAKLKHVVLKGTEIALDRTINKIGTNTSLSVVTAETKIRSTPYSPAAFSFTLDGVSALPKAVFVNLETDEVTIKQMAELADVAVRLTPPGQLAGLANPFSSVDVFDKLDLSKLPSDLIKIDAPKIYLATPGAVEPEPIIPPLPAIIGAGVHVRGMVVFTEKIGGRDIRLAEAKTKVDFGGLHIDTNIGDLGFGGFGLKEAKFKLDATPAGNPSASFSGKSKIAGINIASAKIGITDTGFSYDIQSACIALLKVRIKDNPTGYTFNFPTPTPEPCLADPLESLAGAIDAGMEIVGKGHQLVTAFSDDAWAGMSQSIRALGEPLSPKSIKDFSKKYSNPVKALDEVADKGKEVIDDIADSIGGLIGSSDSRKDGPRFFIRPDDCGDRDDWNIKWGTCWRRGHELIRTEQYHGLCLSVNGRKKIKNREVQIEFCHGDWNQQWRRVNKAADTEKDVRLGSVIHGWTGEGCLETETGGHPTKIRQNGCNKRKENQQFKRDFVDRLVAYDGRCLQVDKFADDAFIFLNTCQFEGATGRAHPNQRWLFQDASSFGVPLSHAAWAGNARKSIKTTALSANLCLDAPTQASTDNQARFVNCNSVGTNGASWVLTDGRLESVPRGSNRNCLAYGDGSRGVSVMHGPCPTAAGPWLLLKAAEKYLLMHAPSNLCLAMSGAPNVVAIKGVAPTAGTRIAITAGCDAADNHVLFTLE